MMRTLRALVRFWETVRYVPLVALMWRVRARMMVIYYRSPFFGLGTLRLGDAPEISFTGPLLFAGNRDAGEHISHGTVILAGKPVVLRLPEARSGGDGRPMGWFPPQTTALGHFTLHYHEWLADLRATGSRTLAQQLLADWLVQFGGVYHPVAWHPYPTSLRLVAWLTHAGWVLDGADEELVDALKVSLVRQLLYVRQNLEHDLGGNHLLKNIKALLYGAVLVEGQQDLLSSALALLVRELRTQILADGSHYELSPMYMAQVLRDLLEVRALLRKAHGGAPALLDEVVHHLGTALGFFRHGDGQLALFNDASEMDADTVSVLLRLSGADDPAPVLPKAGYARLQRGKTLVLFDAGKVGPDENPGHAHADTLAFELSYGRERIVVSQGTYAYQDKLRHTLRGTAAHSTVCVDGVNSADVWGVFRVGRRPHEVALNVRGEDGAEIVAVGSHDGYACMGVRHARKLVVGGDGSRFRGEDELVFEGGMRPFFNKLLWGFRVPPQRAVAHFHLENNVVAEMQGDEVELRLKSGQVFKFKSKTGRLDIKESRYAPQFGVMYPSRQIVIHGRFEKGVCRFVWEFERVTDAKRA